MKTCAHNNTVGYCSLCPSQLETVDLSILKSTQIAGMTTPQTAPSQQTAGRWGPSITPRPTDPVDALVEVLRACEPLTQAQRQRLLAAASAWLERT